MSIATTLRRWAREIIIAGLAFFGVMFIIAGIFGAPKSGGAGFTAIALIIGIVLLVLAAIEYQNNQKLVRVERATEGMTAIEREAYLEEKGRQAARMEKDNI
ncbi:MAG: hypothetical protein QXE51_03715 [Nitrososphaeria archaeon]